MDGFIGRRQVRGEFAEPLKLIGTEVIDEVQEKIRRLKLPKAHAVHTVLIHSGEPHPAIDASDYFDFIIDADQWLAD